MLKIYKLPQTVSTALQANTPDGEVELVVVYKRMQDNKLGSDLYDVHNDTVFTQPNIGTEESKLAGKATHYQFTNTSPAKVQLAEAFKDTDTMPSTLHTQYQDRQKSSMALIPKTPTANSWCYYAGGTWHWC